MPHFNTIHDHYTPRINAVDPGWKILDWATPESQLKRFETLLHHLRGRGQPLPRTLLDVGCGTADLLPFLQAEMPELRYTGVDLLGEIIDEAKRRHPGATLLQANLFERNIFAPRAFDVVFCSGAFNLELGNNAEFLTRALPVLWELTEQTLVVNLLHDRTPKKFPACHYYAPADVLALCKKLTPDVTLDESYLPNDFTVVLKRQ